MILSKFKEKRQNKKKETPAQFIRSLVILLLVLLSIRTLIWEPFRIPSESMLPRLEVGDFISVNKMSYGFSKISPTFFALPFLGEGRSQFIGDQPKRGDVIVFKNHNDNGKIMIKRLIGLPNDRVQVQNGTVYINDIPLKKERLEPQIKHRSDPYLFGRFREYMPNGQSYVVYELEAILQDNGSVRNIASTLSDNTPVFVVPDQHYFFLGDNRDRSADSREWGFIEETYLLGRANLINFNFFQSLKGQRFFMKMYTDKDYDTYQRNHSVDQ